MDLLITTKEVPVHTIGDFVAAAVLAPTDLSLRLVFADYLDEHGESDWAEATRTDVAYHALCRTNWRDYDSGTGPGMGGPEALGDAIGYHASRSGRLYYRMAPRLVRDHFKGLIPGLRPIVRPTALVNNDMIQTYVRWFGGMPSEVTVTTDHLRESNLSALRTVVRTTPVNRVIVYGSDPVLLSSQWPAYSPSGEPWSFYTVVRTRSAALEYSSGYVPWTVFARLEGTPWEPSHNDVRCKAYSDPSDARNDLWRSIVTALRATSGLPAVDK